MVSNAERRANIDRALSRVRASSGGTVSSGGQTSKPSGSSGSPKKTRIVVERSTGRSYVVEDTPENARAIEAGRQQTARARLLERTGFQVFERPDEGIIAGVKGNKTVLFKSGGGSAIVTSGSPETAVKTAKTTSINPEFYGNIKGRSSVYTASIGPGGEVGAETSGGQSVQFSNIQEYRDTINPLYSVAPIPGQQSTPTRFEQATGIRTPGALALVGRKGPLAQYTTRLPEIGPSTPKKGAGGLSLFFGGIQEVGRGAYEGIRENPEGVLTTGVVTLGIYGAGAATVAVFPASAPAVSYGGSLLGLSYGYNVGQRVRDARNPANPNAELFELGKIIGVEGTGIAAGSAAIKGINTGVVRGYTPEVYTRQQSNIITEGKVSRVTTTAVTGVKINEKLFYVPQRSTTYIIEGKAPGSFEVVSRGAVGSSRLFTKGTSVPTGEQRFTTTEALQYYSGSRGNVRYTPGAQYTQSRVFEEGSIFRSSVELGRGRTTSGFQPLNFKESFTDRGLRLRGVQVGFTQQAKGEPTVYLTQSKTLSGRGLDILGKQERGNIFGNTLERGPLSQRIKGTAIRISQTLPYGKKAGASFGGSRSVYETQLIEVSRTQTQAGTIGAVETARSLYLAGLPRTTLATIPQTRQVYRSSSFTTGSNLAIAQSDIIIPRSGISTYTSPRSSLIQVPGVSQSNLITPRLDTLITPRSDLTLINPPSPGPTLPRLLPPEVPGPTGGFFFGGFPDISGGGRGTSVKKQRSLYRPSLLGIERRVRGRRPKILTGVEIRPIGG